MLYGKSQSRAHNNETREDRMKKVSGRIDLCIVVLLLAPLVMANAEVQVLEVRPMDVTALHVGEGEQHGSWNGGWTSLDDYFTWKVNVLEADDYEVSIIYSSVSPFGSEYEITAGDSKVTGTVRETACWDQKLRITCFERVHHKGTLHLPKGVSTIRVSATKKPETGEVMSLWSLELTPPAAKEIVAAAKERARRIRASTDWFVDAKYGVGFHWTARSQPRRGPKKPFCDAVKDFDVNAFADMVEETGAGYVIFTSTHAPHIFPAPIQAIEKILPGNTCKRDLIGDLADVLHERGIKLILYYPGGRNDEFGVASGWTTEGVSQETVRDATLGTEYINNFCNIFTEIGQRYGNKVAGYYFDLAPFGVSHHYELIYMATKIGNPDRIVSWSSRRVSKRTDFQEYWAGEAGRSLLIPEAMHYEDLQPHTWTIIDDGWVHNKPNTDIPPPRFNTERLIDYVKFCIAKKIVVTMNVSIYQDGTVSPAALKQLRALREAIKGK